MKRILKLLCAFSMFLVFVLANGVFAEENDSEESEAIQVLENHLAMSRVVQNYHIEDSEIIYDTEANEIGYVHNLSFGEDVGYAVTLKYEETYIVNEVTYYASNPYEELDEDVKKVYLGAAGYLYLDENGNLFDALTFNELEAGVSNIILDALLDCAETNTIQSRASTTRYVTNYSQMPYIAQYNSSVCTPTAAAMLVKYYINKSYLSWASGISYSDDTTGYEQLALDIAVKMNTSGRLTTTSNVVPGLQNFVSEKTTGTISGQRLEPNASTYRNEILLNRPVLVTLDMNYVNGKDFYHTVTGIGYIYDSSNSTTYIIARDPGYPNTAPLREVLYNSTNVYEQFTFAVG